MSTRYTQQIFPTKVFLFLFIILLGPLPGLATLFEEEERRRNHSVTRIQSLVQSLAEKLRKETEDLEVLPTSVILSKPIDPDIAQLSTTKLHSKIESILITYMWEQGFIISRETTGSASTISTTNKNLLERETEYRKSVDATFPDSMTLSDYTKIMSSPQFLDVLDDAAYVLLLQEWRKKFTLESPYTNFLPGLFLKKGMLVFCPHPLDVSATREFLSLLYTALYSLQGIEGKPFVPEHQGLRHIFKIFEEHHEKEEDVLNLWGTSILNGIQQFYKEQRVLFNWDYMTRAVAKAKEEFTQSLQENSSQISQAFDELETIERLLSKALKDLKIDPHFAPGEIRYIRRDFEEYPHRAVSRLHRWRDLVLPKIRNVCEERDFRDLEEEPLLSQATLTNILQNIQDARDNTVYLTNELRRIDNCLSIAQCFSNHRGIQFVNPFQIEKDILALYISTTQAPVSSFQNLNPLYTLFRKLLSFSSLQVEELKRSFAFSSASPQLPPLSAVPAEHQEDLIVAYRREHGTAVGVSGFAESSRQANHKLHRSEKNVLREALTNIDTSDKEQYIALQQISKERDLDPQEQITLEELKQSIIRRELEVFSVSYRIYYVNLQKKADLAETAFRIMQLKHHNASLNLERVKHRLLLNILEEEEKHKDKRKKSRFSERINFLQESINGFQRNSEETEKQVQQMQENARRRSAHKYEKPLEALYAAESLLTHVHRIETFPGLNDLLPLDVLKQILLETLQRGALAAESSSVQAFLQAAEKRTSDLRSTIYQEIERIFVVERSKITRSVEEILLSIKEISTSSPLRRAFGVVTRVIQTYKTDIEKTPLDSHVRPLLEIVPSFLHSALVNHLAHKQPSEAILDLLQQPQQSERSDPSKILYSSAQRALNHLKDILSTTSSKILSPSTNSIERGSSTSNISVPSLDQVISQLEDSLDALTHLPQRVVIATLQTLYIPAS